MSSLFEPEIDADIRGTYQVPTPEELAAAQAVWDRTESERSAYRDLLAASAVNWPATVTAVEVTFDEEAIQTDVERRMGEMWLANRPDDERNRRVFPDLYGPLEDDHELPDV